MDWGREGVRAAAARGDVVVIVDVLRFSTAVSAAVAGGCEVYPCVTMEEAEELAARLAGEVAPGPAVNIVFGYDFLSPVAFQAIPPGTRVALPSPNGATCSRYAEGASALFAGALVNATAVASAVEDVVRNQGPGITVVAAGERRRGEDGLRPALEDYLGAGAIISRLPVSLSPEARVCAAAYRSVKDGLEDVLLGCESGLELRDKGRIDDVLLAARMDAHGIAPTLRGGRFVAFDRSGVDRLAHQHGITGPGGWLGRAEEHDASPEDPDGVQHIGNGQQGVQTAAVRPDEAESGDH